MSNIFEKVKYGSKYDNKNKNGNIIIYKIYDNEVRIFGFPFILNNKNIIKLEIEGKEYELLEYYKINNRYNKKILEVKIKGIENVTNMSYMFYKCSSLSNLPDFSKWNASSLTNMEFMFYGCSIFIKSTRFI